MTHTLNVALSDFVKQQTAGRDPSHGWEHMAKVARVAMELYHELPIPSQLKIYVPVLLAVAWLHDVNDHKYDPEG